MQGFVSIVALPDKASYASQTELLAASAQASIWQSTMRLGMSLKVQNNLRANLALASLLVLAGVITYSQVHASKLSPQQVQRALQQKTGNHAPALQNVLRHYQTVLSSQSVCEQVDAAHYSPAFTDRRQQWQVEIKRQYLQALSRVHPRPAASALNQALLNLGQTDQAKLAQFELPEAWQNLPVDLAHAEQLRLSMQDLDAGQQHQRCDQLLAQASPAELLSE